MEYVILAVILILSLVVHNMTVAYAAGIVLAMKLLHLAKGLEMLHNQGINWGIIILTAAILAPIADGSVTWQHLLDSFKSSPGIIALVAGLLCAIAGGGGVILLKESPEIVSSLIIGTMAGVIFFHGIAIGPLIAGGLTYFILQFTAHFK